MTRKPPHSAPHKPRDFFANSDFYSLCGWVICAVCFAAFIAVFRLAPWVDLSVAGWFYDPEFGGWWMANNAIAQNTVFPRVGLRMLGGVVLAGAFITRVGMGGHFLSDAIFAFLFVWLMALILHFAFFIKKSR